MKSMLKNFFMPVAFFAFLYMAEGENGNTVSRKEPVVACLGRIVPGEKVMYPASPDPVSRVVKELRVKRGDMVKKDQMLATTYSIGPASASLKKAKALVALAETKLNILKAGEPYAAILNQEAETQCSETALKIARANLEFETKEDSSRKEIHYAKANVNETSENFQHARELLEKMKVPRPLDLFAAEKELDAAIAERSIAEANLELSFIRAPIDGKVIEIFTYPGEPIGENGLLALADVSNMAVEAQVYISDIKKIKIGANAVISGDGLSGKSTGKVVEITEMVDFNSVFSPDPASFADRRIVKVRIKLDSNDPASKVVNSQVTVEIYGE
ncbi:MAG: hypothetical protein A2017_08880 [Lentisphaerae bacterium GWF2_44_16]|nr:MAG: hypothetical protein A2017_08880 [Lentisphaerae bacterium GWF2_44_16]